MIRAFGQHALLVEMTDWRAAQSLAASLMTEPIAGVEAAVPGLASVLVELGVDADQPVEALTAEITRRLGSPDELAAGRERTIPVVYGGEHGPELTAVAAECGLSADEYAARHGGQGLRALFCGFAPGFAYLGELPQELRVPRLPTPRTRTPAGSVAVAGAMSGAYPAELPGGWRVIGRTPLLLFDPRRDPPAYLAPGDTVRFEPMTAEAWPASPVVATDW